jgi:hypothetical protein
MPQIPPKLGAHYLQRPTKPDATQVRVLIGCVFVYAIIESKTCHIYKTVLQTVNTIA